MIRTIRLDNLHHRTWVLSGRLSDANKRLERVKRRLDEVNEKIRMISKDLSKKEDERLESDLRSLKSTAYFIEQEMYSIKQQILSTTQTYLNLLGYMNYLNNTDLRLNPVLASVGGVKNHQVGVVFNSLLVFAQINPSHSHLVFLTKKGLLELDSDDNLNWGLRMSFVKLDLDNPQNPLLNELIKNVKENLNYPSFDYKIQGVVDDVKREESFN